jgi:hypothetical protein
VSNPDLEAQQTQRIKDTLDYAVQRTGKSDFAKLAGIGEAAVDGILHREQEYIPLSIITLACQLNKSYGDTEPSRTSISECLKGAILRLPQHTRVETAAPQESVVERRQRARLFGPKKQTKGIYDPTALRIMGFSVSLFTFVVLGYFLGGIVLGPIFGYASCIGVMPTSPWITPCPGSGIGLVLAFILDLGYTYYYFVKKL